MEHEECRSKRATPWPGSRGFLQGIPSRPWQDDDRNERHRRREYRGGKSPRSENRSDAERDQEKGRRDREAAVEIGRARSTTCATRSAGGGEKIGLQKQLIDGRSQSHGSQMS